MIFLKSFSTQAHIPAKNMVEIPKTLKAQELKENT